jgi:Cu2+-exporting ATPase
METKNQQSENEEKNTIYHCPMRCEEDKTYDHPGNCPVCNMKLVPVGDKNSHSHHHNCC